MVANSRDRTAGCRKSQSSTSVPTFSMARLLVPPRSKLDAVVAFPRQAASAVRLYRRTPSRLRHAEPAARIGVTVASMWFGALYVCLAVYTHRTSALPLTTLGYVI